MHYIVFDLEFNQDFTSINSFGEKITHYPLEIVQIGAIKLDENYHTVATFNRYVKPTIYSQISTIVTELTDITTDQLLSEEHFPAVFYEFVEFINDDHSVFCTWGMSDMKVLFNNVAYHKLDKKRLPIMYINLQPYVSTYLDLPKIKLLNLKTAVEALEILMPYSFHNALNDAYYTAELLKAVNHPAILPKRYEPEYINLRPIQRKKVIDFEKLLLQFEKMYSRELSNEEQDMIKLAYQMGKTHQFLKFKSDR